MLIPEVKFILNTMSGKEKCHKPEKTGKYFTVPTELFLSKDGEWFHEGVQITNERIIEQFNRSLRRDGDDYFVNIGWERGKVVVEDAPYMVKGVRAEGDKLILELSDFTEEKFDPIKMSIGAGNVPYIMVKSAEDRARFTRPAYYHLASYLVEGPDGSPALKVGDRLYSLDKVVSENSY